MKITPYDTGKVKIGCYYTPKHTYCNNDQDWIQKQLLDIKPSYLEENLTWIVCYALLFYIVLGLMSRSWYD